MNAILRNVLAIAGLAVATQAAAQLTFYERQGFEGRSFTTSKQIGNFERYGFNDRASSVTVDGNRWEVCEDVRFRGRCVVLRPGHYSSLAAMGLNDRVSSARIVSRNARVADHRYAPPPVAHDNDTDARVTFYEGEGFAGRSFTTEEQIRNFERHGFNDRASSVMVVGGRWEVCEDARYSGRCVVLRPGRYASLAAMGLNNRISSVRTVGRDAQLDERRYAPAPVAAHDNDRDVRVTFYEGEGFAGRSFTTEEQIGNFERHGFNDRASSVMVVGGRWEVCEDTRYSGRCVVLRPGRYASLEAMGLNNRVSSVRTVGRDAQVDERRYAPAPVVSERYRRSSNERLFEAEVTSVRAVVGPPEQRCWVEQEQVQGQNNYGVGGAVAGAVIGGILGHQVGGGSGKDLATAGGAVGGALLGANLARGYGGQQVTTRDVQRCANQPNQAKPAFWDVTYHFRGQEHHAQMSSPPGATVTVNERGEPRE